MDPLKETIEQLVSDVLDGTQLKLQIDALEVQENCKTGEVTLRCELHDLHTGDKTALTGNGVGVVDALVRGMLSAYGTTFVSLRHMRFTDFSVRGKHDPSQGNGADSLAEATLRVSNGSGQGVLFSHTSPSVARSALHVTLQSMAFFINCERAFVALHKALLRARQDKRPDSVQRYTQQLAVLVQLSSYNEVLENLDRITA